MFYDLVYRRFRFFFFWCISMAITRAINNLFVELVWFCNTWSITKSLQDDDDEDDDDDDEDGGDNDDEKIDR